MVEYSHLDFYPILPRKHKNSRIGFLTRFHFLQYIHDLIIH